MEEKNFHNFLRRKAKENGSKLIFQKKDGWSWKQITWPDLTAEVESIACFLLNSGFNPGDKIIVLSKNTLSCFFFELAIFTLGGISLPARNMEEVRKILENSEESYFFLSETAKNSRELLNDPSTKKKIKNCFLSVNEKISPEEKTVNYSNVVKFGFLARKKLKDELNRLGSLVKQDFPAAIFNAGGDSAQTKSFSQLDILELLRVSEKHLEKISPEEQTFSYLPGGGTFSKFANLLNIQTATRGAIAADEKEFFTDVAEVMPTMLLLPSAEIENLVNRLRGEYASARDMKNALGGRAKLIVTDIETREETKDFLSKKHIRVVWLKSLSTVPD